jgi:NAD(P)-dependent dehydrogenase (short-subunit alcohol dehydrogenase family)
MSNRLSGKVCIITGTGGGMGREAALTFAREGALVVGCGMFVEEAEATVAAIRAAGGTMVSMQPCDLTKPADCQALVDFAVRTFGRIDVLFNNAAMAYFNWLEDISDAENRWRARRRRRYARRTSSTRSAMPPQAFAKGSANRSAQSKSLVPHSRRRLLRHSKH